MGADNGANGVDDLRRDGEGWFSDELEDVLEYLDVLVEEVVVGEGSNIEGSPDNGID